MSSNCSFAPNGALCNIPVIITRIDTLVFKDINNVNFTGAMLMRAGSCHYGIKMEPTKSSAAKISMRHFKTKGEMKNCLIKVKIPPAEPEACKCEPLKAG